MGSINWGDLVKEAGESAGGNYEPLPDGDYDLKVIEATATTSASGKAMFKITTEVQGGAFSKRRVWDNLVVSPENPSALGIFFTKMAALGVPREFFLNNNPTNAQVEQAIFGKSFRANVGSRVYQGDKKNEIKKYYVGQSTTAPVSSPQVAAPAPAPAPEPVSTVIKIGHVGPTSGAIAHLGKDNENGARMAIEELNAKGITIGGQKMTIELLPEEQFTIGRSGDSRLVLRDDVTSTHHARLMLWNEQWMIQDLDSTNGTFVDSKRVSIPTPVPLNTPIKIGTTTFELRR
jgi:hypothetical protein